MSFNPEVDFQTHMEHIKKEQKRFEQQIEKKARSRKESVDREYNSSRINKRAYETKIDEIVQWENESKKLVRHKHNKMYGLYQNMQQ